MTVEERYTTFRANIDNINLRKCYIKCAYSESTLNRLFKTLYFIPEIPQNSKLQEVTGLHVVNRF